MSRMQWIGRTTLVAISSICIALPLSASGLALTFSKAFQQETIGPGSVSVLTFTLDNTDGQNPVTDMAFTDNLPPGMTIANPALASTDCGTALLSAPAGGSTISFSDGALGPFEVCSVTVNVIGGVIGTLQNLSGDLTSSEGNSGAAAADLVVDGQRPGFSKVFSPASVVLGGTSTLTFTLDNIENGEDAEFISFTDNLPDGLVVASPSNSTTDCMSLLPPTVTAIPGSTQISLVNGGVEEGGVCTVTVDVIAETPGSKGNLTEEAFASINFVSVPIGRATAPLEVTVPFLTKLFIDDPVAAGREVVLEFTITNLDRDESATNVAFTDDLDATLSGLVATILPLADPCGPGSSMTGSSLLSFSVGSLAPNDVCTFSVTLEVPDGSAPGSYLNTTSQVTFDRGGASETEAPATDSLIVAPVPTFTKSFVDDPVTGGGDSVVLSFTIINTSPDFSATAISFVDELVIVLPDASVVPGADPCGAGSTVTFQPLIDTGDTVIPATITLTDGTLAPGGSCTFELTLDVLPTIAEGLYPNVTTPIAATIDGTTLEGESARDTMLAVTAPRLTKDFTDDPVMSGGTVTLEFELTLSAEAPGDVTDIAFTDDLDAVISGLTAIGLPINDVCGAGSELSGASLLTFSGGSLTPGSTCTFSVSLQVPSDLLPGDRTNITSQVDATSLGVPVSSAAAEADLTIVGIDFTKSFIDDPAVAGGEVTLEYRIENLSSTDALTSIFFVELLNDTLSGLTAVGLPLNDVCGSGSTLDGSPVMIFQGGNLLAGASCTFSVVLQIPASAEAEIYPSRSGTLAALLDGVAVTASPAVDDLEIIEPLTITKSFLDDPIAPGDPVTLEFTLTNSAATGSVTSIQFDDDLDSILTGLAATNLPLNDVCGTGSQITGTGSLAFTGGSLDADASCTFSVEVVVPGSATPGAVVTNVTSDVTGIFDSLGITGPPAIDDLSISVGCIAPDGESQTLSNDTIDQPAAFTVCNSIVVGPNFSVVGPAGALTLRAGERVEFQNGTSILIDAEMSVGIDPSLKP